MLINSYFFLFIFLPSSFFLLLLFAQIKNTINTKIYLLILISFLFYALFSIKFSILLLLAITSNFLLARLMSKNHSFSFYILLLGILLNLFLLIYFKYSNYFIDNFSAIFNLNIIIERLVIPIGLSFIVFQQISYLVDQYRNVIIKHTFFEYFLFISFFPKIIAGPILRGNQFFYQLRRRRFIKFSALNVSVGIAFLVIGLFKKIILGDRFGFYADRVFSSDLELLSQGDLWLGMFAYSMQIYFDFSGYSDMAIGVSRIFGIKIPFNFNSPYKAVSIIDFWRRWHITLSLFLKDYLYIPLGGNRFGLMRQFFSILITMILGGLWHGAANTFILWGVFHGVMLILANIWKTFKLPLPIWLSVMFTFILVSLGWVFFRATSMEYSFNYIYGLFDFSQNLGLILFPLENLYHWGTLFFVGFFIVFFMPNVQSISLSIYRYKIIFAPLFALIFLISLLFMSKIQPFIYNAF